MTSRVFTYVMMQLFVLDSCIEYVGIKPKLVREIRAALVVPRY